MAIRQVDKTNAISGLMASPEQAEAFPAALQNFAPLSKFVMVIESVVEKSVKGGFDFVVNSIWKPKK